MPALRQRIDKDRYRASLDRLYGIFNQMSETADEVSTWRCPYKDVASRCTAGFGCRNQLRTHVEGERPVCTGSDDLDYRSAWEV
jgi:hypothetical protein